MPALDGAVERTKAVQQRFQLGGHAIVIQRRGKHQHIRMQNLAANALHTVLLHARALVPAVDAAGAGVNIRVGSVHQLYGVADRLRPLPEAFCQQVGRAVPVWAALQNHNVHKPSPLFIHINLNRARQVGNLLCVRDRLAQRKQAAVGVKAAVEHHHITPGLIIGQRAGAALGQGRV